MQRINVGLVGCGRIMPAHLQGYRILIEKGVDVRIKALVARKEEDALRFRKRGEGPPPREPIGPPGDEYRAAHIWVDDFQKGIDVQIYTDYGKMIREADVDAVDVYTPPHTHHDIVLDSLTAGKHVFVEKPIAITVKSARIMIEAAKKARRVLGVSENLRYQPETRMTKWIIDQGYIGQIQMIFNSTIGCYWSPDKIAALTPWRHVKYTAGGGPSIDWGVHIFDTARYYGGEIGDVAGVTSTFEGVRVTRDKSGRIIDKIHDEVDDTFVAIAKFKSGAVGQFTFSWALHGEPTILGTIVYGSRGCVKDNLLILDDGTKSSVKDIFDDKAKKDEKEKFFPLQMTDPFALETFDFLGAIWGDREMETSGKEGLRDLAAAYAVIESSRREQAVKVEDVESGKIVGYEKEINAHYRI